MMAGPGHVIVECFVPPLGPSEGSEGVVKGEGLPSTRLLSLDPDNLAIAPVPPSSSPSLPKGSPTPAFAVLSTTYGVIELPSSSSTLPSSLSLSSGPLTPDQVQQVFQLLETTCRQTLLLRQQQQQRGHAYSGTLESQSGLNLNLRGWPPLRALVSGLERRLQALGALSPLSNQQVLLEYSSYLSNMTSSEWAQGKRMEDLRERERESCVD